MATEQLTFQTTSALEHATAEAAHLHPLTPLTSTEIRAAAQLVRGLYVDGTQFRFKQITLLEPPKAQLAPYLDALHEGHPAQPLDRKAFVTYYLQNTVCIGRASKGVADGIGQILRGNN
jgi:primary-amine oxidase